MQSSKWYSHWVFESTEYSVLFIINMKKIRYGLNATLCDYARFGQFVMQEGALASGEKLLDQWTKDATIWTQAKGAISTKYPESIFGYQWWN